jgi:molybdopterin synthase sulfur carrier subunit
MRVKYFANVRALTGCLEEAWDRPAATLRELVAGLAGVHGRAFQDRVVSGGRLHPTIIVMVNGQSVVHLDGLDTPLAPDDTVVFFPMVAGG